MRHGGFYLDEDEDAIRLPKTMPQAKGASTERTDGKGKAWDKGLLKATGFRAGLSSRRRLFRNVFSRLGFTCKTLGESFAKIIR